MAATVPSAFSSTVASISGAGVGIVVAVGAGEEQADTTTRATSPRTARKSVRWLVSRINNVVLKVMSDMSLETAKDFCAL